MANDIITAIDKKHYCANVFIDLAKAFDSVNHHILIGRLDSLGFSNDSLAWLPTTSQIECVSSVCQIGGPVVRTSGSLYGGATGFNYRGAYFLCVYPLHPTPSFFEHSVKNFSASCYSCQEYSICI